VGRKAVEVAEVEAHARILLPLLVRILNVKLPINLLLQSQPQLGRSR